MTHAARLILALAAAASLTTVAAQAPRSVVTVQPTAVEEALSLRFSGQLTAAQRSELSPRLSGVVESLGVDAGSTVSRGTRLLKLDDRLARLEAESARSMQAAAEAQMADAERIERETTVLTTRQLLPASQGETARANLVIARAEAASAKARAALLAEQLQRHWLTAPFDGVVVERRVDVGEWVDPSSPVLVLLSNEALRFDARVPQEWFGRIDSAATPQLKLDGRDSPITGVQIEAEVPASDAASRSFLLRLRVPAQTPALLPGSSGTVTVALRGTRKSWQLPRDALVSSPDGGFGVWLAVAGTAGTVAEARRITIEPGLADPMRVLSGLDGSEQVIVRGFSRLRDGETVQPGNGS